MGKKADVNEIVAELNRINSRIETLLKQIPTSDHHKISELYQLINRQSVLLGIETTKEVGTMFLERAKRMAQFLKREYMNALYDGKLRKEKEEKKPG